MDQQKYIITGWKQCIWSVSNPRDQMPLGVPLLSLDYTAGHVQIYPWKAWWRDFPLQVTAWRFVACLDGHLLAYDSALQSSADTSPKEEASLQDPAEQGFWASELQAWPSQRKMASEIERPNTGSSSRWTLHMSNWLWPQSVENFVGSLCKVIWWHLMVIQIWNYDYISLYGSIWHPPKCYAVREMVGEKFIQFDHRSPWICLKSLFASYKMESNDDISVS